MIVFGHSDGSDKEMAKNYVLLLPVQLIWKYTASGQLHMEAKELKNTAVTYSLSYLYSTS